MNKHTTDEAIGSPMGSWSCWIPPIYPQLKLNTSMSEKSYGFCIRGADGRLIVTGVRRKNKDELCSEKDGVEEGRALVYGLEKAINNGYKRLVAECCNLALVLKLCKCETEDKELGGIIQHLVSLSRAFDKCSFSYVHLYGNRLAKAMADFDFGASDETEFVFFENFHKEAVEIEKFDLLCSSN